MRSFHFSDNCVGDTKGYSLIYQIIFHNFALRKNTVVYTKNIHCKIYCTEYLKLIKMFSPIAAKLAKLKKKKKKKKRVNLITFWMALLLLRSVKKWQNTRREFLREILYKNIAIIAIQHGKFIFLTSLAIFPTLLGEIHSSPSGKFPYIY